MTTAKAQRRAVTKSQNGPKPSWLWLGLSAVVILIAALLIWQGTGAPASTLPAEISVAAAFQQRESGAFILDVRTPEEWVAYHIPGSTLIPLDQLATRLNEIPKDRTVVVVCRSGNRSQQGRDILSQAGFSLVTSMNGGLTQWQAAGYPTVSGQ